LDQLYAAGLAPVVVVSLFLACSSFFSGSEGRGLAFYCLAVSVWALTHVLAVFGATAFLGQRLVACGGFVVAAYIHAAYDLLGEKHPALVRIAYLAAFGIAALHFFVPGFLYDPVALAAGPAFWPSMAVAAAGALVPVFILVRTYLGAIEEKRLEALELSLSGFLGFSGAAANAVLLSKGVKTPVALYVILASMFLLADVVRRGKTSRTRKVLEASLVYSAIAAFLSSGFLFGIMAVAGGGYQYAASAFFLTLTASLAFEPVSRQFKNFLGKAILRDASNAEELALALSVQEERADQSARLADLGSFSSSVAHELRGAFGILLAHLKRIERQSPSPDAEAMREQLDRVETFLADMLRYGRPRPLNLRQVKVFPLLSLGFSSAIKGLGVEYEVDFDIGDESLKLGELCLEADQDQLLQVFVILFENAVLAMADSPVRAIKAKARNNDKFIAILIEDSGPGIPVEIMTKLFEPFVTGRKNRGKKSGTGLGLSIAKAIVERHGGSLTAGASELGGACFCLELPKVHKYL